MSLGIKETKEIIEGMGELASTAKKLKEVVQKILKDGISAEDIVYIGELTAAMPDTAVLSAASKDAKIALDELKDLDKAEVVEIIGCLYAQAEKFSK